ncbi:uncharacterized protein TNCV_1592091 [Trichonephila clavipes]|nr:uncharacterized protein TNCV_1592091 [Trichonephila clavipes]
MCRPCAKENGYKTYEELKLVYSKKGIHLMVKTIGGKGRLTDSLIDKLGTHGNAIRYNSTSVKEMRKAIWAVWGHSCSTDDEPIHWFCPTNPNTWCKYNAAINNNLQKYINTNPQLPKLFEM